MVGGGEWTGAERSNGVGGSSGLACCGRGEGLNLSQGLDGYCDDEWVGQAVPQVTKPHPKNYSPAWNGGIV